MAFQRGADRLRLAGIAPGALLDDALHGGDREGDPGGLDALQVNRRQQARTAMLYPTRLNVKTLQVAQGTARQRGVRLGRLVDHSLQAILDRLDDLGDLLTLQ